MPASSKKSEPRSRSKSAGRRSRSRSRSRGRSKSPGRVKAKASPSPSRRSPSRKTKAQESPSPARKSPSRSSTKQPPKAPTTPTRSSARIAQIEEKKENDREAVTKVRTPSKSPKRPATSKGTIFTKAKVFKKLHELGELVCIFVAPATLTSMLVLIFLACTKESCTVKKIPKIPQDLESYFNSKAFLTFACVLAAQALLSFIIPGNEVEALQTRSGKKLKYKMNGFLVMLFSVVPLAVATYMKVSLDFPLQHTVQMVVAGAIISFILSVLLYIKSRKAPAKYLAKGSFSAHFLYGREMDPQVGRVDLKTFFIQTGLIMLLVLDAMYVLKSHDASGKLNIPLILVATFQSFYIVDALWFESALLTTADFKKWDVGFLLIFMSLVVAPVCVSVQTRFLLEHPQSINNYTLAGCVVLYLIGYVVMRGSNSQKDKFRRNPHDPTLAHLETIPSPSGKKLLVSGWWGMLRHPNYLGDLLTALAWTLPCGFNHVLPWMYIALLLVGLIVKAYEDDALCREKHGTAWNVYCKRVKYRIIPYVF